MATPFVRGASPITFVSEDTAPGNLYQVPLSLLGVNADGSLNYTNWKPAPALKANDAANLTGLLKDQLSRGVIVVVTPS